MLEPKMNDILTEIGVSGYETCITGKLYAELKSMEYGDCYIDSVGNLVLLVRGENSCQKVMVTSHIDEVGFQIVSEIAKNEYRVRSLGNVKTWNMHQQKVVSKNARGYLCAKAEESMKSYNYENMYLCVTSGFVETGDVFTFDSDIVWTSDTITGRAIDNRVSCQCLINIINKRAQFKNDVYFVFTVQEEIGMRGMRVAKSCIQPDLVLSIDTSGVGSMNSLIIGEGVGIKLSDSMGVSNDKLVCVAKRIAREYDISYQLEVSDCGTSELIISNEIDFGRKELGLTIPCRNMHTANAMASASDVNACENLLYKMLIDCEF